MSFGVFNPSVKNLLPLSNEWKGTQTYTKQLLGTATEAVNKLRNITPASSGSQQVSPSRELEGRGWATNSGGSSQIVKFDEYILPVQGTANPSAIYKKRFSVAGGSFTNLLELYSTVQDGLSYPSLKIYGMIESSVNNSSTIGTLQNLLLTNPSGSKTNVGFKFGSVIKAGFGVDAGGAIDYRGFQHNFYSGSTAESALASIIVSQSGIYNYSNNWNAGVVTAGSSDTGATVRLSSYGGFAGKGVLVTGATYTYGDEMAVYGDGSAAFECSGTATACSTYSSESTCNSHSLAGCNWFAGNSCGDFSSTSEGTCEGNSGCTWEESSCASANNTDQTSCESQDDTYGGTCSWDTSTCPSIVDSSTCNGTTGCSWSDLCSGYGDQSNCEANSCTWNFSSCATDFFDESSCNGQSGCSWNGATCDGQYNTSCTGGTCSGNLCNGNYATGNCSGTYGTACQGTSSCSNLTDDGETLCEAESGCSWLSGANYTLPSSNVANRGNVSRFYYTANIGSTGNINVIAGAGDTLQSSIALAPGESVLIHHFARLGNCSSFTSEGACSPSGCSWFAYTCGSFSDESTCNAQSGFGCSWDGDSCEGTYTGTVGSCSGSYSISSKWYKLGSF